MNMPPSACSTASWSSIHLPTSRSCRFVAFQTPDCPVAAQQSIWFMLSYLIFPPLREVIPGKREWIPMEWCCSCMLQNQCQVLTIQYIVSYMHPSRIFLLYYTSHICPRSSSYAMVEWRRNTNTDTCPLLCVLFIAYCSWLLRQHHPSICV